MTESTNLQHQHPQHTHSAVLPYWTSPRGFSAGLAPFVRVGRLQRTWEILTSPMQKGVPKAVRVLKPCAMGSICPTAIGFLLSLLRHSELGKFEASGACDSCSWQPQNATSNHLTAGLQRLQHTPIHHRIPKKGICFLSASEKCLCMAPKRRKKQHALRVDKPRVIACDVQDMGLL